MNIEEMRELVGQITYKPNWKIKLIADYVQVWVKDGLDSLTLKKTRLERIKTSNISIYV